MWKERRDPKLLRWSEHPLLRELSWRQRLAVISVGDELTLPAGSNLKVRGDVASFIYLVRAGCVLPSSPFADGNQPLDVVGLDVCQAGSGSEAAVVRTEAKVLVIATRYRELLLALAPSHAQAARMVVSAPALECPGR